MTTTIAKRRSWGRVGRVAAICLLGAAASACTPVVQRVGIAWLYREVPYPGALVELDVPYASAPNAPVAYEESGAGSEDVADKHRLDFFRPDPAAPGYATGWPVLVFVHGGGWTHGDRAHRVGGADVYRNIGRYFASHGVGAAIVSYRLQPGATWAEQVADVGRAVRWVQDHVGALGGDPDAIVLSGHSAGAHLSARFALDPDARRAAGADVCRLILVSGAAYDLADPETYALGASRPYFVARFDDGTEDWERRASVVPLVRAASVPALVVHASGEPAKLVHQSDLLAAAYRRSGAPVEEVVVPGEDHERIVLTLSRDDKTAGPAMLEFVRRPGCGPRAGGGVAAGS